MYRRIIRPILIILILIATIVAFIYYFAKHPAVRYQLGEVPPHTLVIVLALYLVGIAALAAVMNATLRLCRVTLGNRESLLLTAYSSIINFFGPLQSGPAFRAVYLKKKYDLNLKNYAGATLVYYFIYGGFSVLFLLSGVLKYWLIVVIIAGLCIGWLLYRKNALRSRFTNLDIRAWYYLAFATFLQVAIVTLIYFVELRAVSPHTSIGQAIVYSGAANLALFVSLTPGAIGFRETFLVFSRHLHHISNTTIVTVNIIDRAMYIVLLLALAILIFGTHASRQFSSVAKNRKKS